MIATLPIRNQEATASQLSYVEFLELLVEDELNRRRDNLLKVRIKKAGFPAMKTLEEFDFGFNPSINKKQLFDLATARFIPNAEGILFLGPPGVGKSHLGIALGLCAVKAGYKVLYKTALELLQEVAEAKATGDHKQFFKTLNTVICSLLMTLVSINCLYSLRSICLRSLYSDMKKLL